MAEYSNELRGVLFKNEKKTTEQHPAYTGSCEIEGTAYWLSCWVKEGKNGKFMSLAFKPKDEAPSKPAKKQSAELADDVPF